MASAMSASFCGVLKIHAFFASIGAMIAADAAIEIIDVFEDDAASIIASELGVIVEPTIAST